MLSNVSTNGFYVCCFDSQHSLFFDKNVATALLYIVDFKVTNLLRTSCKKQKITGVYCVILNCSSQFRAILHSIQPALLGKSRDIRELGYELFLSQ